MFETPLNHLRDVILPDPETLHSKFKIAQLQKGMVFVLIMTGRAIVR